MDNNQNQPNNPYQTQNPVTGSGSVPPVTSTVPNPMTPPQSAPAASYNSESSMSNSESAGMTQDSNGGKKKPLGLMIGALLVLLLVFIGLIYFFVLRNPSEPQQPVQQLPVQDLPQESTQEAVTPTPELTEETVDGIDIGSPEADLSPIQSDLDEL
jgi:hypothetical protein